MPSTKRLWQSALDQKEIVLVCGTGGVGKTSMSAAIALALASRGRRVGLITIDPARRLATALGLSDLSHAPVDVASMRSMPEVFSNHGSLHAMMFDSQKTLHDFVVDTAGKRVAQTLSTNRLYQIISDSFSGTHDYLAMEMLYKLHASAEYDVIVLDTPPARHVLEFLDAPGRIANFFDDKIFQWFLPEPKHSGFLERLRARSTKTALGSLEWLTGKGVMHDFSRLAPHLYTLKQKFLSRQKSLVDLIRSSRAGILFVTSPEALAQQDFLAFRQETANRGLATLGLIVNRSYSELVPTAFDSGPASNSENQRMLDDDATSAESVAHRYFLELSHLAKMERIRLQRLADTDPTKIPILQVPELLHTDESLESLVTIGRHLGYYQ